MLIKVRRQNWDATFAYAPPLEDAVINTDEVVSAVPVESRGVGLFMSVRFRDGTSMTVQGRPDDLLARAPARVDAQP